MIADGAVVSVDTLVTALGGLKASVVDAVAKFQKMKKDGLAIDLISLAVEADGVTDKALTIQEIGTKFVLVTQV